MIAKYACTNYDNARLYIENKLGNILVVRSNTMLMTF